MTSFNKMKKMGPIIKHILLPEEEQTEFDEAKTPQVHDSFLVV